MSDFPQVIGYKIIKFIGKGSTSMVYLAYSEVFILQVYYLMV